MIVAQAAGTLLEIGLQMKNGVAVLGVAGAGDFPQFLCDGVPLAQHQAWKNGLVKLLVKRKLAGKEAAIERRQRELEIIGVESPRFLHCSGTRTGAQTNIPHTLNHGAHRIFRLLLGLLVGEGEQNIDVGIREKVLAPVAAQCEQRNIQRGLRRKRSSPHFNEDTVDNGRAAVNGRSAIPGALAGLANQRHLPRILLPKIVNRQSDWMHKVLCETCRSERDSSQDKRFSWSAGTVTDIPIVNGPVNNPGDFPIPRHERKRGCGLAQ